MERCLPRRFDAWDIDSQTEQREIELKAEVSVNITCASGIYAELEMNMRFSSSEIRQRIRLMPDAEQLEFYTEVEWHEMHRLLKVSFDTGIEADNAVHQIQFGTIARPAHRSRQYDADRFEEMDADYKLMLEGSDYYETCSVDSVIKAYKNDELLGYLITITDNEGYGGDITLVSAIKSDGTINGISILTINETAGLGMNAKKPEFYEQFAGRKVDKFVYTKSGATKDSEIDAISSATITTNAVTNAVNASIVAYDYIKIVSLPDVNGGAN